ncbi:MAG: alpha-L-fucosidase, partial [Phycisphaerae bacterium]
IMDWHHPDQKANFPKYHEYLKGQVRELLTGYGKIGVMWFDGEWIKQWDREKGRELAAFCRSIQPELVINNRVGKRQREDGDFGTPEQRIPPRGLGYDWETCMTMNSTWGFKKHDHNWKSTADLLRKLVDIASKGGNFLLNVGPTAEGLIPEPSVSRLKEMGKWLAANGESVHGTSATVFKSLAWGRCTTKPGKLYLHVFDWPADGKLIVPGLSSKVDRAYLLSDTKRASLPTGRTDAGTVVDVPAAAPDAIDTVVVLEVTGEVEIAASTIGAGADGSYTLGAADAETHGGTIRLEGEKDCIGFWTDGGDWVSWDFKVAKAGTFDVQLTYACEKGSGDSTFSVAVGDRKVEGKVRETGSWTKFVTEKLGTIELDKPGAAKLSVKAKTKPNLAVMNLRGIKLVPVKGR